MWFIKPQNSSCLVEIRTVSSMPNFPAAGRLLMQQRVSWLWTVTEVRSMTSSTIFALEISHARTRYTKLHDVFIRFSGCFTTSLFHAGVYFTFCWCEPRIPTKRSKLASRRLCSEFFSHEKATVTICTVILQSYDTATSVRRHRVLLLPSFPKTHFVDH